MNAVTAMPATGSAHRKPAATATRPTSAPREDRPSSYECRASATRVAELILLPVTSFVPGDDLVADDAQRGAGDAEGDVAGGTVAGELADALVPGERGAGPDDHGDADPGQVIGAVQAIGVALGRPGAGYPEAEEHHGAGRHVGQVVDRVQQPDRPGQDRQQQLDDAGGGQPGGADRDSPVRLAALLHVITAGRQRERGGRVLQACGLVHPAMMAVARRAGQIRRQVKN